MKTKHILKVLPVIVTLSSGFSQTAAERLEQGVQLQSAEGDLKGAIAEYQAVLDAAAKSQRLAAEARYRLAECYSQLGKEEKMREQLEALRADFPADNKWVRKAVSLAPPAWNFSGTPWQDQVLHTYEVRLPNGATLGNFLLASQRVGKDPDIWETIAVRTAGSISLSRSVFAARNYESQSARWYIDVLGDVSMTFKPGGKVSIVNTETGEEKASYDHGTSADPTIPMFENEQAIQIIRALNLEIGTKQKTIICAAHNAGMPIPFDLEVTAHEEIETPAGKFKCAKIETSIKQSFYISLGEKRELVRMDVGAAKIDLVSTESWNPKEPATLKSEEFGSSITLSGAMIYGPPNVDDEVYRLQIFSSDFAGTWGLLEINKKSNLVEAAQAGSREYALELHKGFGKSFDEFKVDGEWEEMELDGVKAVATKVTFRKGEIVSHAYQVHAVGEDKAMSFRLHFAQPDEEKALARAKEIVGSFRW